MLIHPKFVNKITFFVKMPHFLQILQKLFTKTFYKKSPKIGKN